MVARATRGPAGTPTTRLPAAAAAHADRLAWSPHAHLLTKLQVCNGTCNNNYYHRSLVDRTPGHRVAVNQGAFITDAPLYHEQARSLLLLFGPSIRLCIAFRR